MYEWSNKSDKLRKKGLILFLMIFLGQSMMAQNTISGKLIDENDQPISFVEVTVTKESKLVTFTITEEDGSFSVDLPKGKYVLLFNYFGNVILNKEIEVAESRDLGALKANHSISLDEVKVRANLIKKEGDKLIMNISGNTLLKGRSTLDVLKHAPHLSINPDNGAVSMKGKATAIMVNGKMIQVADIGTYLSTLPSEKIASIEIISNPSSRYDATGGGGIINIITKELKNGVEGTINTRVDVSYFTSYNSYVNLNAKLNKRLTLNTYVNYNKGKGFSKEKRTETLSSPSIIYDYDRTNTNDNNYIYASSEAIYDISKRNKIGIGFSFLDYNNESDQNNALEIFENNQETFSDGDYFFKRNSGYWNANLNHTIKLDL